MRKEFLEAGRIVGTHGIKGELRLEPWCDSAAFLTGIRTLYWDKDGRQPVGVLHSRPHKSFLLLTLEGVSSATEGDTLRGRVLYFKKADIALPNGRVFVQDLLQCTVKNAVTGQVYGKVTDVTLYPIDLGMKASRSQRGLPRLSGDKDTLCYLQSLSAPFGTTIEIKDGVGTIRL